MRAAYTWPTVDLGYVKDLSIVLAGLVAVVTFVSGAWQYARQGRDSRVEHFVTMRRRFLEDPVFRGLLNQLATGDPSVAHAPVQDRRNFVGFLEEVALMVNSRLVRPDVAHYMFGYYVGLVDSSDAFWEGLERDSAYWTVFRRFAADLRGRDTAGHTSVLTRF